MNRDEDISDFGFWILTNGLINLTPNLHH